MPSDLCDELALYLKAYDCFLVRLDERRTSQPDLFDLNSVLAEFGSDAAMVTDLQGHTSLDIDDNDTPTLAVGLCYNDFHDWDKAI